MTSFEIETANVIIDQAIAVNEQVATITEYVLSLSETQKTAKDLYERGFHVFPLPSGHEWALRARMGVADNKHPYRLKMERAYGSRLYLDNTFIKLFDRSNIGVMTGRLSGNLVDIDCDSHKAFEFIGKELTKGNIPFWAFTSADGGHYWVRVIEGEVQNIDKRFSKIKDVEIWGNCHYAVVPPSIHPSGEMYRWQTPEPLSHIPRYNTIPAISIEQLDYLGLGISLKKSSYSPKEIYNLPEWAENISNANVNTWMNGAKAGSRNSALSKLCYDLRGNDIDRETAREVLIEAAGRCTPAYNDNKGLKDIDGMIRTIYNPRRNDIEPSRSHFGENKAHKSYWEEAEKFANAFDWNSLDFTYEKKVKDQTKTCSMKAHVVKRVFLALIERSKIERKSAFRATVREVSEIANLQKVTVNHAFQCLIKADLIKLVEYAENRSSVFSFVDYSCHYSAGDTVIYTFRTSVSPTDYSELPKTNAEKDVFGSTYYFKIWKHLLVNPSKNPYQVAKALNMSPSTAYNAMRRMQDMGLISFNQAENLWFGEAQTEDSLYRLSEAMGTVNKSQKREEKHQIEREKYLNQLFVKGRIRYEEESQRLRNQEQEQKKAG